jgi:hypothetical protein
MKTDHRSTTKKLLGMSEAADRRRWRELVREWSVEALKEGIFRYSLHARTGTNWLGMPVGFYTARAAAMANELEQRGYLRGYIRRVASGEQR